jgi:hypothetical protein
LGEASAHGARGLQVRSAALAASISRLSSSKHKRDFSFISG